MAFVIILNSESYFFHGFHHKSITSYVHDSGAGSGSKPQCTDFLRITGSKNHIGLACQRAVCITCQDNELECGVKGSSSGDGVTTFEFTIKANGNKGE